MDRDDTDAGTEVAPGTLATRAERAPRDRSTIPPETLLAKRYRIQRRIGKGGMGEVMLARDEQVGREVAIKRMKAANPPLRAIARFLREASIQGRLEHPAIAPVHEIGHDDDGMPFFAMKKLTGVTLAKLLEGDRAAFPIQRTLRAFTDVCLAVELAHVRGIVHRDLKPENIMMGDYGEVYVLDWGVAKVIGEDDDGDFADVDSSSGEHATIAGTAIGTPGYMAPEQARGAADIDGRADVYTLGCLLFEILVGEPLHPRGRDGLQSALVGLDTRPSKRGARRPDFEIPPELDTLCVMATALDRRNRMSARELGERVQRFLDGDRDLALRRNLAREHLARAHVAFETDPAGGSRKAAMRESTTALALDPTLAGAAELVGRLMLEPPRESPREVELLLREEDVRIARVNAWAGIWSLVFALAFIPLVWWVSPSSPGHVAGLATLLVVNLGICSYTYVTRVPRPGLLVVTNAIMVCMIGLTFSPILVAPGIGAVLALAMALTPRFSWLGSGIAVGSIMLVGVLGPLLLEQLGVLPETMHVGGGAIVLHGPGQSGPATPTLVLGVLYTIGLIAGAAAMGDVLRTRFRDAARRLHLQAWQLRQLVPAPPTS